MRTTAAPSLHGSPADGLAMGAPLGVAHAERPAAQHTARLQRHAQIALLGLMFALPLKSALNLDQWLEIGSLSVVSVTKLAALWFFVAFVRYARALRYRFRFDALHVLLFALLAVAALSALHARVPATGLATTLRYAGFVALFVACTQLLDDPALQLRAVWATVASGGVAGVIALRGFMLGELPLATLPYGDPNDVAFSLATTLPLGIWLLVRAWSTRAGAPWRAAAHVGLAAALVVATTLSVLFSLSRGAWVGLSAAALLHVAVHRQQARTIAIGGVVALLAGGLLVLINPGPVLRSVQSKQTVGWANVTNRLQAWGEAIRLIDEHPRLGVGPGNFQFYYAEHRQPGSHRLRVVHNTMLEIGAELGLAALGLFLAYVAINLVRLTRAARLPQPLPGLAAALRAAWIVAVVAGLFVSEQFLPPFWLLGALASGVWHTVSHERGAPL